MNAINAVLRSEEVVGDAISPGIGILSEGFNNILFGRTAFPKLMHADRLCFPLRWDKGTC
jgi:hypothetical protein